MQRPAAPPLPAPAAPGRFRLTRYFSLASLVGVMLVTACLLWAYRELAQRQMVEHEDRANAGLTQLFANEVWARYRGLVAESAGRTREELLAAPGLQDLRQEVLQKMAGLQVRKVKIYNLRGVTVFSTDEKQIGEDKGDNVGLQAALSGLTVSQITYRERFDAFEGVVSHRNLISSYIPVRSAPGAPVEGVFEVYSDVTPLLAEHKRVQWQVAGIVFVLLGTLYLFLLLVVRKADRIIAAQATDRAEREAQVRHLAFHDALTGLPNRASFIERWAETIALAGRHGRACALMFVDLDRFKDVNDTLGHAAGDELLRTLALRMQGALRDSDMLYRVGGDEFTVILPEIAAPEDAAAVAQRIQRAVAEPVLLHGRDMAVGTSIGISVYPGDGGNAEALLRNADIAMYAAKQSGRGGALFYGHHARHG